MTSEQTSWFVRSVSAKIMNGSAVMMGATRLNAKKAINGWPMMAATNAFAKINNGTALPMTAWRNVRRAKNQSRSVKPVDAIAGSGTARTPVHSLAVLMVKRAIMTKPARPANAQTRNGSVRL